MWLNRKRFSLINVCLLSLVSITACSDNKMMPPSNPPEYQNQLVRDTHNKWHVIPIECPILYDEYGRFDPNMNLGCSQTRNLGLMVANPSDLLGDMDMEDSYGYKRRKPIKYRNQPLAKSAQKYYDDDLPKVEDPDSGRAGTGGNSGGGLGIGGI